MILNLLKRIEQLEKEVETLKTIQRTLNNVYTESIEIVEGRLDVLEESAKQYPLKNTNPGPEDYTKEQRQKNFNKYVQAISTGPSALKQR